MKIILEDHRVSTFIFLHLFLSSAPLMAAAIISAGSEPSFPLLRLLLLFTVSGHIQTVYSLSSFRRTKTWTNWEKTCSDQSFTYLKATP